MYISKTQWNNFNWIGCGEISLSPREYLSSVVKQTLKLLTNSLKTSDPSEREIFRLNSSVIYQWEGLKCFRWGFSYFWYPLKRLLPKVVLKKDLLDI